MWKRTVLLLMSRFQALIIHVQLFCNNFSKYMYSSMFFVPSHSQLFFFQPKQLQGFQGGNQCLNQELERSKKQNLPVNGSECMFQKLNSC